MGHLSASAANGVIRRLAHHPAGAAWMAALLMLAAACVPMQARTPARGPDADEYAVWSAVLDSLMPGSADVRLLDTAFVIPLMVKGSITGRDGGRTPRLDAAAVDDFLRRNGSGVRLEARFSTRRPVVLVRTPAGDDWTGVERSPHLVLVSRPGFDRRRRRAIVSTAMTCGVLCGQGNLFELERGPDGRWKVSRVEDTYYS